MPQDGPHILPHQGDGAWLGSVEPEPAGGVHPVTQLLLRLECRESGAIYVNMVEMDHHEDTPLGLLLYRASTVLRQEVSTVLRPMGLTLPEFVCMRHLSETPGSSSAELARTAGVTPQAMNTVLRRLEDEGLASRPETVTSGRALPANLTDKGRTLLKRSEALVRVADERILGKLDAGQQREFKRMLGTLGSD